MNVTKKALLRHLKHEIKLLEDRIDEELSDEQINKIIFMLTQLHNVVNGLEHYKYKSLRYKLLG